jgi:hypothetical protein
MSDSDRQAEVTEQGKLMAALSYGSFFFGVPLGVLPLIQRDDPFALFHAKHATAVWLVTLVATVALTLVYSLITFVTCGFGGILFPILLLPFPWALTVAVHGLVLSMNGQYQEPLGAFGLGELMFGSIQLKEPSAQLQSQPPPPPPSDVPPPPPQSTPPPPPGS